MHKVIVSSIFQENTYILYEDGKAIIIDPGEDFEAIDTLLSSENLTPLAIVNTHGHVDHVVSVQPLKEKYNIPFYLNGNDQYLLDYLESSCDKYRLNYLGTGHIDHNLDGINSLELPPFHLNLIHTPGHTPGGLCIEYGKNVYTGDTIFLHSIGRTDFPGGDHPTLINSIKNKLFALPDDTILYPGHGPDTSIGEEKLRNPFVDGITL